MMNKNDFNDLINTFLAIKTRDEMINFLYGLFTKKELSEISTRLQIVKLLKKGNPQRIIAKKLKVGIATVTRGSKEIQNNRFINV